MAAWFMRDSVAKHGPRWPSGESSLLCSLQPGESQAKVCQRRREMFARHPFTQRQQLAPDPLGVFQY